MTQITLAGMISPRPLALKADIDGVYTRMAAVAVTINGVELGSAGLIDKGGKIQWVNIVHKPVAGIGVTGVVTLSDSVVNDKTRAATLKALWGVNSNGYGFVPQSRQVNSRTLDRDVTLTAEDLYSLTKAQVDALVTEPDRILVWGPAVTTALADVPAGSVITSFISPTDPVRSRRLQIWHSDTNTYENVKGML